jgi:hypothetical protein|nr:MAG TPA: protein of unknown function (DUF4501) [Caudoviricetes sp.]
MDIFIYIFLGTLLATMILLIGSGFYLMFKIIKEEFKEEK